jgi:hypothetical protein
VFELRVINAKAAENGLQGHGAPQVAHVPSVVTLSGLCVLTVRRASVIVWS